MLKQYAYKFQLKTKNKLSAKMRRFAGCNRYVWNKALGVQKERLEQKAGILSYKDTAALLVGWKEKEEESFLKETHSQTLQQTLKDLERALRECFRKEKGFPKFKKKGRRESFRYPQGYKLDEGNSRIYLPKLGWVRYRKSKEVVGKIKNVTVLEESGKWYVSIQVEEEVEDPIHQSKSIVGIDMGIAKFATLSDGTVYESINSFRKLEKKLKKLQRKIARKVKFSHNWKKTKKSIQRVHKKIANVRRDYLHKVSSEVSKNHAIISIEDLKVSNISKSAKGTVENPGKGVKAKSGLNKSILDQGWYTFRTFLEYKQRWRGGILVDVSPKDTSITCSKPDCGHVASENRKTQELFKCVKCGFSTNADLNAALNVLAAGHAALACGGRVVARPVKQEPPRMVA